MTPAACRPTQLRCAGAEGLPHRPTSEGGGRYAAAVLNLDAYLERLGLGANPSIAEVHRAHIAAIPFENLDPHRGVAVELDLQSLQRKLIEQHRGGYCFEHNTLLRAALEAMGAGVEAMLARVRWNFPAGHVNGLTHMVLRVTLDGVVWLADVGFGGGTLLEPIPFGPGGPYEQSGWLYRVIEEGDELVLQLDTAAGWRDVYAFLPRRVEPIDIELGNWWMSTHPSSGFVKGLTVSLTQADGSRVSLSDRNGLELTVRTPEGSEATPVAPAQIPGLLAEHFGLGGFTVGADGRVALAEPAHGPAR